MEWSKILLALVIILLYIPMVFMGANVFFPEYTDYYDDYRSCNMEKSEAFQINDTCLEEQNIQREAYQEEQNKYNGNKYIFIVAFGLITLLLAFTITVESSIIVGLFLGAVLTSFFATWIYFNTQSKIGFGILVLIFFWSIYFINTKKKLFIKK